MIVSNNNSVFIYVEILKDTTYSFKKHCYRNPKIECNFYLFFN